jgi:hypothetical protein
VTPRPVDPALLGILRGRVRASLASLVVMGVLTTGAVAAYVHNSDRLAALLTRGARADGVVTQVLVEEGDGGTEYAVTVKYQAPSGPIRNEMSTSSDAYDVGQHMTVYYDPHDPAFFRTDGLTPAPMQGAFDYFLVLGGLLSLNLSLSACRAPRRLLTLLRVRRRGVTVALIARERDPAARRLMISGLDSGQLRESGGAELLDKVHEPPFPGLIDAELWRVPLADEPLVVVKCRNSSRDPDGSFRSYWLRVDPSCKTAHQALAWTWRLDASEYSPTAES